MPGSNGEQRTRDFAFLASLMKLVQEKSENEEQGLLQPGAKIPIVLDAPFGTLAANYIAYISDILLSVSDQLSVLMLNKDWQTFESACDARVGREYVLVKNNTGESGMPVVLEFAGRSFDCVVYGAAKDCTTVDSVR